MTASAGCHYGAFMVLLDVKRQNSLTQEDGGESELNVPHRIFKLRSMNDCTHI